jgi:hypothetical protein
MDPIASVNARNSRRIFKILADVRITNIAAGLIGSDLATPL